MGEFSIFHWLVVLAVILIFFGGKRIPEIMKGFGEGIRSFKDGMAGTSQTPAPPTQTPTPPPAEKPAEEKK
jgi:sec-independent protein translocase protein TatA